MRFLAWLIRPSKWTWNGGSWECREHGERNLTDIRGNRRSDQEWAEYRAWKEVSR